MTEKKLQHFYIAEEQSIYLLSHKDATKLKTWVELCQQQLELLGYSDIQLIGKGAYGFVFAGKDKVSHSVDEDCVFKFSRLTLPQHVQDRFEEEAHMQRQIDHPQVPKIIEYRKIKRQSVVQMARAPGIDLEQYSLKHGPLPAEQIVDFAIQLIELLRHIRNNSQQGQIRPIVHGDIKPSNLVFDEATGKLQLVDWGSAVYAQVDAIGQSTATNVMDLMSGDLQHTNARLGDIYFIGPEQLNGGLSSPRFDEQGAAATLYALASGQSSRYGKQIIPTTSLGLPKPLAQVLDGMLSDDAQLRQKAGDYFINQLRFFRNLVLAENPTHLAIEPLIPVWVRTSSELIDTVVYGSRKSFLRAQSDDDALMGIDDAQLEKYYKNYLSGMGDNEKAFIAAVSRLGSFPVVGGLAVRWQKEGVYIDSNLTLFDPALKKSFQSAVNNMINLAQGIFRIGMFKSCLFNARTTLHVERESEQLPFVADTSTAIPFDISDVPELDDVTKLHSYFEDGKDPDEYLHLPDEIMAELAKLNLIHHTGCIIFEVLPTHLKIHSYLMLLNHEKHAEFKQHLNNILKLLPSINGLGISGFMKLPYKDTRFFEHISQLPDKFYPKNPKLS
ncbi:serine/threonine protein kinase [Thalassotalea euphylliae]|uniref:non-specific serine/threonine protein kinase n=1 Tax=Thalassotalea euphylliae TaxID=1655234 RepID=A0A3E0TSI4_9GAMM|nr:protein kinase [Thalassotalea euphylliae]REL27297.1 serine/threonine protein kinase [Thalassotalea euphylliae]